MILDKPILDSLMTWASLRANGYEQKSIRRRVRLEITAETGLVTVQTDRNSEFDPEYIICRVYLAEPRCTPEKHFCLHENYATPCELGPLAETRIG